MVLHAAHDDDVCVYVVRVCVTHQRHMCCASREEMTQRCDKSACPVSGDIPLADRVCDGCTLGTVAQLL
jgi:hypothetical protein